MRVGGIFLHTMKFFQKEKKKKYNRHLASFITRNYESKSDLLQSVASVVHSQLMRRTGGAAFLQLYYVPSYNVSLAFVRCSWM